MLRDTWLRAPAGSPRVSVEKMALPGGGLELVKTIPAQRYSLHVVRGVAKSEAEIEKQAWSYVLSIEGQALTDENGQPIGRVAESYISRGPEFAGVKKGDWLLGVQWTPEAWASIQRGTMPTITMK